jgi:hypothetical protein
MPPENPPIIINNFRGSLTRIVNGDLNSGFAKFSTSFGYETYGYPNNLRWQEQATQIDSGATVIQDLILKLKNRVESGVPYCYAIGYAGRFYKINITTDVPTLISATGLNLKYGGGMEFFKGTTEKVYIGHDAGLYQIGFDGTGGTAITSGGVSWVSNVPRPMVQFGGFLYVANDTNLVEISSAETVSSASKLAVTVPANYHIVDLDVDPQGRYIMITANRMTPGDMETSDPLDTTVNLESGIFYWNGVDTGISNFEIYPSFSMTSLVTASPNTFRFGYDIAGAMIRNDSQKILTMIGNKSPFPEAIGVNGNLVGWGVPETSNGKLVLSQYTYGSLDIEVTTALLRPLRMSATGSNTDIMVVGSTALVSNLSWGSNSYVPNSVGKVYFSTYETGGTPTAKFYKWSSTPPAGGNCQLGVYETQTQLFSGKIKVSQIRVYTEPTATGNGFQIDLIGSDGNVISGGTVNYTYTAGSEITQNQGVIDLIDFNPEIAPTYAIGVRITNTGTTNLIFHKIEIDTIPAGK